MYDHVERNVGSTVLCRVVCFLAMNPSHHAATFVLLLWEMEGMPGNLLHQLLGPDHSSRASPGGFKQQRYLLRDADNGSRVDCRVHLVEQLGHDQGGVQQATHSGDLRCP